MDNRHGGKYNGMDKGDISLIFLYIKQPVATKKDKRIAIVSMMGILESSLQGTNIHTKNGIIVSNS